MKPFDLCRCGGGAQTKPIRTCTVVEWTIVGTRRGGVESPRARVADTGAAAREREDVTRRAVEGAIGRAVNMDRRYRARREISMTTRERSDRHPRMMSLLPSLAHSRGVDPKSSPFDPDFHVFFGSRDENLAEHFRGKGDSVSWGIAESIKKYEEDTKKKVSRGADIASLYDQETERALSKEVENRIDEALLEIMYGTVARRSRLKYVTCAAVARLGHLDRLKYLHENGCPWDESACDAAVEGGHLECLKYLHENGCAWDEDTCTAAAEGGHLECLKYLCENDTHTPLCSRVTYHALLFSVRRKKRCMTYDMLKL